jgi:hypothetical protein
MSHTYLTHRMPGHAQRHATSHFLEPLLGAPASRRRVCPRRWRAFVQISSREAAFNTPPWPAWRLLLWESFPALVTRMAQLHCLEGNVRSAFPGPWSQPTRALTPTQALSYTSTSRANRLWSSTPQRRRPTCLIAAPAYTQTGPKISSPRSSCAVDFSSFSVGTATCEFDSTFLQS